MNGLSPKKLNLRPFDPNGYLFTRNYPSVTITCCPGCRYNLPQDLAGAPCHGLWGEGRVWGGFHHNSLTSNWLGSLYIEKYYPYQVPYEVIPGGSTLHFTVELLTIQDGPSIPAQEKVTLNILIISDTLTETKHK